MMNASSQPNILFIITDQQRWDTLGCYGNVIIQTPNLDGLAEESVRFENGYCTTPLCGPARASILTGRHPHTFGNHLRPGMTTLADLLSGCGYHTAAIGKMHFANSSRGPYGFQYLRLSEDTGAGRFVDDYQPYLAAMNKDEWAHGLNNFDLMWATSPLRQENYITAWTGDEAVDYLTHHRPKDRPFFAIVSFVKPHPPFDPPVPYNTMYDPFEMPPAVGGEYLPTRSRNIQRWAEDFGFASICREDWIANIRAHYYGLITGIDDQFGRIVRSLKAEGVYDNTAIAFLSDHGEMLGDQGLFMKHYPFNASLKIPFLFKAPGLAPGVCGHFVDQTDLLPTVCDLVGITPPEKATGRSLIRLADGTEAPRAYHVSVRSDGRKSWIAVVNKSWKYHYYINGGEEELFAFGHVQHEGDNLAYDPLYEEIRLNLRQAAVNRLKEVDLTSDEYGQTFVQGEDLLSMEYEDVAHGPRNRYLAHRRPYYVPE